MAETTVAMSGANEGAATTEQERVQESIETGVVDAEQPAVPTASPTQPDATDGEVFPAASAGESPPAATTAAAAAETSADEAAVKTEAADAVNTSTASSPGDGQEAADAPPPAAARIASNQDDEIAPVLGSAGTLICNITLLLPTGKRHPFKIDEKYLAKRGVEVPEVTETGSKDPFSISVYKLKELILREWREDWENKPASPSSIRLIHFGKLLDDMEQLRKYLLSLDSPNVVHMSVKPPEMFEDEEATKGKSSARAPSTRNNGGGCCVIL
ncbi:hypothetical protein SEPCBS119000_001105 [Sporothrix epigloea]|uniref:UBL3-like ubiquitin domain-containing protein n=1 Tax=Sporothrix epigloea TaxID=1892477 RepID=A0ABP0D8U2_9PEZI